jgi:hypothetical protein
MVKFNCAAPCALRCVAATLIAAAVRKRRRLIRFIVVALLAEAGMRFGLSHFSIDGISAVFASFPLSLPLDQRP